MRSLLSSAAAARCVARRGLGPQLLTKALVNAHLRQLLAQLLPLELELALLSLAGVDVALLLRVVKVALGRGHPLVRGAIGV